MLEARLVCPKTDHTLVVDIGIELLPLGNRIMGVISFISNSKGSRCVAKAWRCFYTHGDSVDYGNKCSNVLDHSVSLMAWGFY
jgi:hypothetical protein